MNKALTLFISVSLLCSMSLAAEPIKTFQDSCNREVLVYAMPQEGDAEQIFNELEQLKEHKVMVAGVSPDLLSKYLGVVVQDEESSNFGYLDVRAVEQSAQIIASMGYNHAMEYLMGSAELNDIYEKYWMISHKDAQQLEKRYGKIFSANRQKFQPMMMKLMQLQNAGKNPSELEMEAMQAFVTKFCNCFIDHLFMHFKVTRKTLVAEHEALIKEIESYNDLLVPQKTVQDCIDDFRMNAIWLQDTTNDESLNNYVRRIELISKQELEQLKAESSELPRIEEINLLMLTNMSAPFIALRTMHLIAQNNKVAIVFVEPMLYGILSVLLEQAGFQEKK